MKSNYKPIGKHIRLIDERNKGLRVQQLLGLSISKRFIPSVANIIGTDMENYKIIRKNQFACSTMQVRRDKKMPVALLQEVDEAIISQAYPIFEVKDEKELLPEYLMMWFERSEFDREACFHAVGGVRGSLEWEDFESMQLPVPHISKQREIVQEYNSIQNRINLNQQLIQKLEETAQAIYREWFVEGIDLENLPEGWRIGKLNNLIEIKYGKAYSHLATGDVPLYGSGGLMSKVNKALYTKPSVLIPRKGTLNNIMFVNHPFWCVDTMFYSIFNDEVNGYYSYYILKQLDFDALNQGSAVPSMTTAFLNDIDVVLPNQNRLAEFNEALQKIISHKENLEKETQKLTTLKSLLLAKMATIA
ncbi:MAG: restriction endonuclease subunit S [Bacteroidetes bacterium]|nr:restriction endonuclease subunit S [Bacteroidota bacterium]